MKKLLFILSVLCTVNAAFGQTYIVTYLKGNVYHDNKPLKLHDRVDGVAEITSTDKTPELFQISVANYVQPYTPEKTLTTRGDFDLKTCFNPQGTNNKALIID